jgi:hypothetical protein
MENVQRQTLLRSSDRLGIIYEHIITGLGRQAELIEIHCHGIDGKRNNITLLNTRELHKKFNLVFDP